MENKNLIVPTHSIQDSIFTIRGVQVMLDSDLAGMYEVETRILNQTVKRNIKRFPSEFMFQLTKDEFEEICAKILISKENRGGRRKLPLYLLSKEFQCLPEYQEVIIPNIQLFPFWKQLVKVAQQAGVNSNLDFAVFQNHGYKKAKVGWIQTARGGNIKYEI